MYYCSPKRTIEKSLKLRNIEYIPLDSFNVYSLLKIARKFNVELIHAHNPAQHAF